MIKTTREWFDDNGRNAKAVIGLSGGKDSAISAAILAEALGHGRIIGVSMPDGIQTDIMDAIRVAELLDIELMTVNISEAKRELFKSIRRNKNLGNTPKFEISKDAEINTPPRLRMAALYAIAASCPTGGMVINNGNASERYVGYFTKFGDGAGDFAPLADYTVTELLEIGKELCLPEELVIKTPSDGLSGMSDEEKLGFSYAILDKYILTGECENQAVKARIDQMHRTCIHKLKTIPFCTKLRETA